jgi:hypothetical protein
MVLGIVAFACFVLVFTLLLFSVYLMRPKPGSTGRYAVRWLACFVVCVVDLGAGFPPLTVLRLVRVLFGGSGFGWPCGCWGADRFGLVRPWRRAVRRLRRAG